MRALLFVFALGFVSLTSCVRRAEVHTAPEPIAVDRAFLELLKETGKFRAGRPWLTRISPDGQSVYFLRSTDMARSENVLYVHDVASGAERVLLRASDVLQGNHEPSAEERALLERLRLGASVGITGYELDSSGRRMLVPLMGELFVVDLPATTVRRLPSEGGYANSPQLSPNGAFVSCVRDSDLYVIDIEAGTQVRLTDDASDTVTYGLAEFVAQEEMGRYTGHWWAADSSGILFQRTDESAVPMWHATNPSVPQDEPSYARYPQAGANNAEVRLFFVSLNAPSAHHEIVWDRSRLPYLASVTMSDHSAWLVLQDRRQQYEVLTKVNLAAPDAALVTVLEERDAAWINLDATMPVILDGDRLLWTTERNGKPELELRTQAGALVRTFSFGSATYRELFSVEGDTALVGASDEPSESHVFRVNINTGAAEQITSESGIHSAELRSGTLLQTHETATTPMQSTVRRGEHVTTLRSVARDMPWVPQAEFVTVTDHSLRARITRPANFDPARRYPVLLDVYAGPGHQQVRKAVSSLLRPQWIANHGFIVVAIDGRGTPARGRDFERVIRGNFIDVALADQIAGLTALFASHPEMDSARVGVSGWSFGGYFSAMAVAKRSDFFRAAIAGAPVSDWHLYDTHYTERYLGLPDEAQEAYAQSSVLAVAAQVRSPLLLIHGTSDDNVYFAHSLQLHEALLRASVRHEFLALAGQMHGVSDPTLSHALEMRELTFLQENLGGPQ